MAIITSLRAAAFAAAFVLTLLFALSSGAAPAQADNCQPEELVVRAIPGTQPGWESVLPDESDPRCVIAAQLGCPNQADPAGCTNGIRYTLAGGRGPECYFTDEPLGSVRMAVCRTNEMLPYLAE